MHLEFLSLKGGCRGSSESTLVNMPHFWKSHALAHICFVVAVHGGEDGTAQVEPRTSHPANLCVNYIANMGQCMRFPTMWYVRPARPQISLRMPYAQSEEISVT